MQPGAADLTWRAGSPLLTLCGEIDERTLEPLTDEVLDEYRTDGDAFVDVFGLEFLDSGGIGLLLRVRERSGGRLHLVGARHQLVRLLEMNGITGLFALHPIGNGNRRPKPN